MAPDTPSDSAVLLIHCPDRKGIVSTVTKFIQENNGNILFLEQHVDREVGVFFMRIEWDLTGFAVPAEKIGDFFDTLIARRYDMRWKLYFSGERPRMAVFVSRLPHCLFDILSRWSSGEWKVDIPVVVSNHPDLQTIADHFGLPFSVFPITRENKAEQERREIELLQQHRIDFVVLARYMQILSPALVAAFPNRIINIHHSFLPAFPGARPYQSAHERGVKVIGATSHYVTEELDTGPIIEQDVHRVSHMDSVQDLIRKGRDLEKVVLARAVWAHLQRKTLVYENRTVVFS